MYGQQKQEFKNAPKRITHEQMSALKANHFVEELALDDNASDKFKDVYLKYMEEMHSLWKEYAPKKPEGTEMNRMKKAPTDDEVEKMIKDRFAQSRKMLDIREKYYNEFRKFLSPKQIQKVYGMEIKDAERFHHEMNRRIGKRHSNNNEPHPMPH